MKKARCPSKARQWSAWRPRSVSFRKNCSMQRWLQRDQGADLLITVVAAFNSVVHVIWYLLEDMMQNIPDYNWIWDSPWKEARCPSEARQWSAWRPRSVSFQEKLFYAEVAAKGWRRRPLHYNCSGFQFSCACHMISFRKYDAEYTRLQLNLGLNKPVVGPWLLRYGTKAKGAENLF